MTENIMKILKYISLLAVLFSFNALAVEGEKPQADATAPTAPLEADKPPVEQAAPVEVKKPCPVNEAMKKMKAMYWSNYLTLAGVDAAIIEKVQASMEEMMNEEHIKYKEVRTHFKAETLKRLTDAGLIPEKAAEVMATFKEKVIKYIKMQNLYQLCASQ